VDVTRSLGNGPHAAELHVTDSRGNSTTKTVSFTVGPPPAAGAISVSPTSLKFPGTRRNDTSKPKKLTVKNTGQGTLTGSVGTPTGPFEVTEGGGSFSLAPGQRLTVKVVFGPTAAGPVTGSLPISSSDPAQPMVDIALSGRGK